MSSGTGTRRGNAIEHGARAIVYELPAAERIYFQCQPVPKYGIRSRIHARGHFVATYRLWTRITELMPGKFLVVVAALGENATGEESRPQAESRVLESWALAEETRTQMVAALAARLKSRGHTITRIEVSRSNRSGLMTITFPSESTIESSAVLAHIVQGRCERNTM